ncbi:hypothetical protein K2173_001373 [Erythroxylum novogranatense]|uniref:Senescence regulator n=1 Tax=Erythroxylum novogranatense TaxID=1862640 RepID=A0AAV8T3J5_9ROSI|nr:hypothetical protein K2173_001373 [Erythroxylum novogranatense]
MAKGRRLTTSRSERYLGSYGYGESQSTAASSAADMSEFGEEDVWSTAYDLGDDQNDQATMSNSNNDDSSSNTEWSPRSVIESNGSLSTRNNRRRIPQENGRHVGGLTSAFEDSSDKTASPRIVHQFRGGHDRVARSSLHMATSAPVNVPDWSKILRVDSVESLHELDDGFDDPDTEMIPPHEYLAREYARSKKMGGASVFEGVGRTLKGRDMRRVRDAVWSQTGFDG